MTELVIVGGGAHARSVFAALRLAGGTVRGYVDPQPGRLADECRYLGDDAAWDALDPDTVRFVNGLGSTRSIDLRRTLFEHVRSRGFAAERVLHPRAFVDPAAVLGEGVQVMAGAIVNTGAVIGDDVLINSAAVIEHDVVVGAHSHVAPGALVAGDVRIGESVHVGLGARVIQGTMLGSGSVIGAGAVVIADVPEGATVVGVPGRVVRIQEENR